MVEKGTFVSCSLDVRGCRRVKMPLKNRVPKPCPVCKKPVKKLSQHLRDKHGQAPEVAQAASKKTKYRWLGTLSKAGRQRWHCGIESCGMNVVRRVSHLKRQHHLQKATAEFTAALCLFTKHQRGLDPVADEAQGEPEYSDSDDDPLEDVPLPSVPTPSVQTPSPSPRVPASTPQAEEPEAGCSHSRSAEGTPVFEEPVRVAGPSNIPKSYQERRIRSNSLAVYQEHLQMISGGHKSLTVATQHARQVDKFWVFGNNDDISVFNSFNLNKYVLTLTDTAAPGTIKSYLCSIKDFVKYAFSQGLLPQPVERLNDCVTFIENCMKYINQLQAERQTVVDEASVESLLSPEARDFVISQDYLNTVYAKFGDDKTKHYQQLRNAVVLYITISNGTRVSAIMNMTSEQVKAAVEVVVEGSTYRTVSVSKHKTSASRGAFKISLPISVFEKLEALTAYVMKKYGEAEKRVFRNQLGAPYSTQSGLNFILQHAWKDCGAFAKFGRMNSKINRQSMTCIGREKDSTKAGPLAEQMRHQERTGTKFYHVWRAADSSAKLVHWLNSPEVTSLQAQLPRTSQTDEPEDPFQNVPTETGAAPEAAPEPNLLYDSDLEAGLVTRHKFPSLPSGITIEEFRRGMVEVLASRDIEEFIDEANSWRRKTRKMVLTTSIITIHECLSHRLEQEGIDLSDELMNFYGLEAMSDDVQVRTNLLSVLAVEIGRYYGCGDDAYSTKDYDANKPTVRPPAPVPEPPQTKGKKRSASPDPDRDEGRQRFPASLTDKARVVFKDLIKQVKSGEVKLKMALIREYRGNFFPGYTDLQLRDKVKNLIREK